MIIDVNDLAVGEMFWTEITGREVGISAWNGRYSHLVSPESGHPDLVLQLVDAVKGADPNRAHLDIAPTDGVDAAISRIIELGGRVKKEPSIYPRPGSSDATPSADWAVLQDPFGNEFCLIDPLSREQRSLILDAARSGVASDHDLRVAAGLTR